MNSYIQVTDILWTGGWDSTYRVLELVFVHGALVQPHYIVDSARPSTIQEIQAIESIRLSIANRTPELARSIRPTKLFVVSDIEPDPIVTSQYKALLSKGHIGSQNDWLSRYVRQHNLNALEMGTHKEDGVEKFLRGNVVKDSGGELPEAWKLADEYDDPNLALLSVFRFPLLHLTKVDMREKARAYGFLDILEQSWFCYQPIGGKPCGRCNPCKYTIEENMGYRLPMRAHVTYRLKPVLSPILPVIRRVRARLRKR